MTPSLPIAKKCNVHIVFLPLGRRWQVTEMDPDTICVIIILARLVANIV